MITARPTQFEASRLPPGRSPLAAYGPLLALLGLAAGSLSARADVTVQQQTSMSLAGIKIDVQSTERTSGDKQRRDSTTQCHGLLALVCHNVQSGEIVRLDKQLEWQLEPKKKTYLERSFPTPEQRALAQQQMQAAIEEMKKCQAAQPQNASQRGPDTSRCQLSPPVINIKRSDEHTFILGHDAHKASVVLTQSCTDTQTGDVCEFDYGFDSWLTTDDIPGNDERTAFTRNYLTAQGLDPTNQQVQGAMQQFMAPYMDQLKQLKSHAGDLEGHPLRTTFYVAVGGPHCGQAKQAQQQQAQNAGGGGFKSLASNALRGGLSGLFHHGLGNIDTSTAGGAAASGAASQAADPAAAAAANAATGPAPAAGASGAAGGPTAQTAQIMSLTTETTGIDTSSIPGGEFEIPAGWHLQPPQAEKEKAQQFSCPTPGG
jgi:hypothetical protein